MFGRSFWMRFLKRFDRVTIMARPRRVDQVPPGYLRVTGGEIDSIEMPFYHGPYQYLLALPQLWKRAREQAGRFDAYLLRLPQNVPIALGGELVRQGIPFAVDMVGDPYDVLSSGAEKSLLRPHFQRRLTRKTERLCRAAASVCYVTQWALQRRYPARTGAKAFSVSDVELDEVVALPRSVEGFGRPMRFVTVGAMNQLYKGQDVLIRAFAQLLKGGMDVRLRMIGDGKLRPDLEALAHSLGCREAVEFVGQVTAGKAIFEQLDASDVFVLPSRQEGLPRAMVEAMARGLPCIGSRVGGIPELLEPEWMVEPGDVKGLVEIMKRAVSDRERLALVSRRNLGRAGEFLSARLDPVRQEFINSIPLVSRRPSRV
jgi:glycosyltransferase involved in cell wall biosynthesis